MRNEKVNVSSSLFMLQPSTDFVSSEEGIIQCLEKIDKVMEERRIKGRQLEKHTKTLKYK